MIFETLRKLFGPVAAKAAAPGVPDGERYYIVGDIHGRLDLFEAMIDSIELDDARAGKADSTVILLGDLVDRGPDSAGVLRRAREWQAKRQVRILLGNHEDMFLESLKDCEVLQHFLKYGGRETILSFGVSQDQLDQMSIDHLFALLPELVPHDLLEFMSSFEEMIVAGDYVFVHAGIEPLTPLNEQMRSDMLWIRDRFLRYEGALEKIVVHGHTIFDEVADCGNRIGIDTGAFRTGKLTALVLEAEQRSIIQVVAGGDGIETINRDY